MNIVRFFICAILLCNTYALFAQNTTQRQPVEAKYLKKQNIKTLSIYTTFIDNTTQDTISYHQPYQFYRFNSAGKVLLFEETVFFTPTDMLKDHFSYQYDDNDQLVMVIHHADNILDTTFFEYNAKGVLVKEKRPTGQLLYTYNKENQPVEILEQSFFQHGKWSWNTKSILKYETDKFSTHRVSSRENGEVMGVTIEEDVLDKKGNIIQKHMQSGASDEHISHKWTENFKYTKKGLLLEHSYPTPGDSFSNGAPDLELTTTTYSYNAKSNLPTSRIDKGPTHTILYEYSYNEK